MDSFRRFILAVLAVLAIAAMVATPAAAQSIDGYNDVGGQTQDEVSGGLAGGGQGGSADGAEGQAPAVVSDTSGDGGALPFTGMDLALLLGAGGLLGAAGLGMRRLTRAPGAA
jgi:hypothetical protein